MIVCKDKPQGITRKFAMTTVRNAQGCSMKMEAMPRQALHGMLSGLVRASH